MTKARATLVIGSSITLTILDKGHEGAQSGRTSNIIVTENQTFNKRKLSANANDCSKKEVLLFVFSFRSTTMHRTFPTTPNTVRKLDTQTNMAYLKLAHCGVLSQSCFMVVLSMRFVMFSAETDVKVFTLGVTFIMIVKMFCDTDKS